MADLEFKVPENRTLDNLPGIIHDAEVHVLRLKEHKREEEAALKTQRDLLKRIHYRGLGSTDKERDAAWTVFLESNKEISDQQELIDKLDFTIKVQESLVTKLTREWTNAQLKLRRAIVRHEIFGGIPVSDATLSSHA